MTNLNGTLSKLVFASNDLNRRTLPLSSLSNSANSVVVAGPCWSYTSWLSRFIPPGSSTDRLSFPNNPENRRSIRSGLLLLSFEQDTRNSRLLCLARHSGLERCAPCQWSLQEHTREVPVRDMLHQITLARSLQRSSPFLTWRTRRGPSLRERVLRVRSGVLTQDCLHETC